MKYRLRMAGTFAVIEWTGDVDMSSAPDARAQVVLTLDQGRDLLIDLSAVHHIDSSGVAVLVEGHTSAIKHGLRFGLISPSKAVLEVLRLAHIDGILAIHATVESASSSLKPQHRPARRRGKD
ncbi:MAG: STAS domain-containing protein [Gammaproteobacteria bacterium]|nr:STAS domain-containing protein [Gammaproteobacteria bacterium]